MEATLGPGSRLDPSHKYQQREYDQQQHLGWQQPSFLNPELYEQLEHECRLQPVQPKFHVH